MRLLKAQQEIAEDLFDTTIWLEGTAGTGKTTAAIERVKQLVRGGVAADSILVIVPQMALGLPYQEALRRARLNTGGRVQIMTLGSLAYAMVDLFWPLIADKAGFGQPYERPHFLSLELVQYYMTRFVEPEIHKNDYFNSVHISRHRLYTQIVDNLNKSAVVGFPHEQLGERLKSAWLGADEQEFVYDDAQASANLFRQKCLEHNLLDFSLQVDLFIKYLWKMKDIQRYLTRQYRHLIVDNIEEDTPATHDVLMDWLSVCESAVVIYDTEAGYRRFLGADAIHARRIQDLCLVHRTFDNPRVMSNDVEAFEVAMTQSLKPDADKQAKGDPRAAIAYPVDTRYHTQMIDWTVENIASLIHDEGVSPNEIVVLGAYLPDALRYSLQTRLREHDVQVRSHRPSRALREEPAARTLLTLSQLAHPKWGIPLSPLDVTYALTHALGDVDLVRARLLVDVLFRAGQLQSFERIQDDKTKSRITFEVGTQYERLRQWLTDYSESDSLPLDVFFSKLFGEVLSQPQFGFHRDFDAANTAANLIDSAQSFRQAVSKIEPSVDPAPEYIKMVDEGVIANLYLRDWEVTKTDAVLLAPAHTYLMTNRPVDYQFWLNIGSTGWAQRLHQPLTQPYVLSRQWNAGEKWTDILEQEAADEALYRLVVGLIRRCRKRIYLGFSEYGEQGFEQRGSLLMAVQGMLRRLTREAQNGVV